MNTSLIRRARVVALDSSHWARLAYDWTSADRARHVAAAEFIQGLVEKGWLPLLCWHHLEELFQHNDEALVDRRLHFLRSLPLVAWIRSKDPAAGPGSILDVLGAEVRAAHHHPTADLMSVRDLVRDDLLRVGSAADAIPAHFDEWRLLRPALRSRQTNSRKVAAISRWRGESVDDMPLSAWTQGKLRPANEVAPIFDRLRENLTREIEQRGDKRIDDARAMAGQFFLEVSADAYASMRSSKHSPAIQMLMHAGLTSQDLARTRTVGEALDLIVFYKHLAMIAETEGLPLPTLKETVHPDRLPVTVIAKCLRVHGQDPVERKGSDLNDVHLLSLAPYADYTYVDKRTWENARRASGKRPDFAQLVGRVSKSKDYEGVDIELNAISTAAGGCS